jgi:DinB superfamily
MDMNLMQTREELAAGIEKAVDAAYQEFKNWPEEAVEARSAPGEWTAKEVLGHLIDSASNNHQRFVRLQLVENLVFPNYGPDNSKWIQIQKYQARPWGELLELWRHFNLHLAWMIRTVDPQSLGHVWQASPDRTISLADMMNDYMAHINNHVQQIRANVGNHK